MAIPASLAVVVAAVSVVVAAAAEEYGAAVETPCQSVWAAYLHQCHCLWILCSHDTLPTSSNTPFSPLPFSSYRPLCVREPKRPTSMPLLSTLRQMMRSDFVL